MSLIALKFIAAGMIAVGLMCITMAIGAGMAAIREEKRRCLK